MIILRALYYFFEIFILLFKNFKNKNFLILTPRFFSILIKKVFILNLNNKIFFSQNVRNFYDINTVYQIFGYEEYDLSSLKIWKKTKLISKKKSLIVDCGSNIGSSSRYFAEIFSDCQIIAIEPDFDNYNMSKKNIFYDKIKIINSAVASKNLNYKVISKKDPRAHRIKYKKGKKENITMTINQILKLEKNFTPYIIKIDIEGFEKELFKENIEWMDKFKIIIIEIHDWMLPSKSISSNFIRSLAKTSSKSKRDLIIKGENLISIKIS